MNRLLRSLFILLPLLLVGSWACAQTSKGVVQRGLDAYVNTDASGAVKAWLKGSALETDPRATSQAHALRQVEDFYGKVESYQLIAEYEVSERSRMVYFVVHYAKGPAFGRMLVYRTASGEWVSTEFRFNTDAAQVFPPQLAIGNKQSSS